MRLDFSKHADFGLCFTTEVHDACAVRIDPLEQNRPFFSHSEERERRVFNQPAD